MTPSAAFEHPPKLQQPQPQSQSQDSVRRRMTMLSESLDRLVHTDRHRSLSLSLPASSPVFAEMKHARSPSAPTALELLFVPLSEDPTPLPARSEDGSQDTGDTGQSAPSGAKEKKVRKPLGTRLRKAAGRAMSLIVPGRGMPPRPKPAAASSRAPIPSHSSTPSGILHPALSIAVDTTTQQEGDTIPSSLVDRLEATVPEEKEDEGDTAAGATLTDLGQLASHTGSPRGGAANDESI